MFNTLITVGAGTVSGALAGGVVARRARRRRHHTVTAGSLPPSTDRIIDGGFDQVAAQWAEAHGQPMAAPLVANKLRLAQRLVAQRSRRWSR